MRDATFSAVPARVRGVSYAGSTTKRCGWQILASSQPDQRVIAPARARHLQKRGASAGGPSSWRRT